MVDLGSARHWAREAQRAALFEGAVAVDATVGTGGDTLALCELVGEAGRVYGFDVQEEALDRARARLEAANLASRAHLFLMGHERMDEVVPSGIDLAVFNLGWLPGSRDKSVTTRVPTTLAALKKAFALLKKGALITLCAYPGHEEGARELAAVKEWAGALPRDAAQVMLRGYLNQPGSPALLAIVKLKGGPGENFLC